MALPTTRDEFIDFCLRKLGAPVVDVNVDSEQVDDRVDEGFKFYRTYHFDAVEHLYQEYQIDQDDIDNGYLTIPNPVVSVVNIATNGSGASSNWATDLGQTQLALGMQMGFTSGGTGGGLAEYVATMISLADMNFQLSPKNQFTYNYTSHKMTIIGDWETLFDVDDYIVVETYQYIDPDGVNYSVWEDLWLQEYVTALIGVQWGTNLSKFDGVQLPGGITLDGDKLFDRWNERKLFLEEEMSLKWELPVDFKVG